MKQTRSSKTNAPAVTCGIFLYDLPQQKILVCHATNAPWNTWSIPKGLKEPHEDAYTCACRELKEETGIDMATFPAFEKYMLDPVKYKKQNKILESFLIIVPAHIVTTKLSCSSVTEAGFPEVNAWKWIEPEKLAGYVHESQAQHVFTIKALISESLRKG
jgi:8-oxo-dGTP pyrophosphatase MutT (NUDIX family)